MSRFKVNFIKGKPDLMTVLILTLFLLMFVGMLAFDFIAGEVASEKETPEEQKQWQKAVEMSPMF